MFRKILAGLVIFFGSAVAVPTVYSTPSIMQEVPGGGQGPGYTFYMSKYMITNDEWVRFLNNAEANQGNARGANMVFNSVGNVGFNATDDDGLYRRSSTNDLLYNSGAPVGSRYTVSAGMERMPVYGCTWYGAMKYCNWLTIDQGLGESHRAYNEGSTETDWRPVHLSSADWSNGFNSSERLAWLNYKGYRLPMDNYSTTGALYNEWYKAAAWSLTELTNKTYGFGRDTITGPDANYFGSGDPWENNDPSGYGYPARTPVGFYDGSLQQKSYWNWPDAMSTYQTNANANSWGVYDLSGDMWKWTADTYTLGDTTNIAIRGGSMRSDTIGLQNTQRSSAVPLSLSNHTGFHIVQVLNPHIIMQRVVGGGQGSAYTFYMSKYMITNEEWVRFLNNAEANQGNARGANMVFNSVGNVGFDGVDDDGLYRRSATNDLLYDSGAPLGSRYTVSAGMERMPVYGCTWYGAMKYCNWLTIDQGLGESQRAYNEGSTAGDWRPVHLSSADWSNGFNSSERLAWLNYKGYRLPMDDYSETWSAYNEWFKAASWSLNDTKNTVYCFGRNTIVGGDANYISSGDPWENNDPLGYGYPARTPVGFYDGSLQQKSYWNWPDAMLTYQTNTNANSWGVYDLSGNMWKWTADTYILGDTTNIAIRGGSMRSGAESGDVLTRTFTSPLNYATHVGFHIVQVPDQNTESVPIMQRVLGGGQTQGPLYTFYMSKYMITNEEWVRFLNNAEANQGNARGANMVFNSVGNVGFDGIDDDGLYRRSATNDLLYNSGAPLGSRYTISAGMERMPVYGCTWYGAMKYCNWLTIDQGLGESQRAYNEGSTAGDWRPVHLTQATWQDGFSSAERLDWLGYKGYRLPMDDYSTTGALYNEWYKVAAWSLTELTNKTYGFGRDTITGPDANYFGSGDPWENNDPLGYGYPARTPVGFYDGSLQQKSYWNWPDAMSTYQTNANANSWGVYDLSGDMWKWTADTYISGDTTNIAIRGGSMRSDTSGLQNIQRSSAVPLSLSNHVGFYVVRSDSMAKKRMELGNLDRVRLLVDKVLAAQTTYLDAAKVNEIAVAGFNVVVPRWNGTDSRQNFLNTAWAQNEGIFFMPFIRGSGYTSDPDQERRMIWADGAVQGQLLSPNDDGLWQGISNTLTEHARLAANMSSFIGTFMDFENYDNIGNRGECYHFSYDQKIMDLFAAYQGISIPPLVPADRYPWLRDNGYHNSFGDFQINYWRGKLSNIRQLIDVIYPGFQFAIYASPGTLFTDKATFLEFAKSYAPLLVGDFTTYARPAAYLKERVSLDQNKAKLLEHIEVMQTKNVPHVYMSGIDPILEMNNAEFCGKNADMIASISGGYWVFYEGPTYGQPDHTDFFNWFSQANQSIASRQFTLQNQPRQNPEILGPTSIPPSTMPIVVHEGVSINLSEDIGNNGYTSLFMESLQPSYLADADVVILQSSQRLEVFTQEMRDNLRNFVNQGGGIFITHLGWAERDCIHPWHYEGRPHTEYHDELLATLFPEIAASWGIPTQGNEGHFVIGTNSLKVVKTHPITNGIPKNTIFPTSSPDHMILNVGPSGSIIIRDTPYNYPVILTGTFGLGKIVYSGCFYGYQSPYHQSSILPTGTERTLFYNILNWLSQ